MREVVPVEDSQITDASAREQGRRLVRLLAMVAFLALR
jgi:hypothetical protein